MSTYPGTTGAPNRLPIFLTWIALLAISTYYSVMPSSRLGDVPGSDKVWHLGGYALLALPVPFLWVNRRRVALIAAQLAAYGVFLECVQWFVPGRSFEMADILANTTGVLLGAVGGTLVRSALPAHIGRMAAK